MSGRTSEVAERDRNGLEILDRDLCRRLLGTELLGRIGVTVNALPVVLPVNYQLFDGQLIIQTERDTRLADATHDTVVAFANVAGWRPLGYRWSAESA